MRPKTTPDVQEKDPVKPVWLITGVRIIPEKRTDLWRQIRDDLPDTVALHDYKAALELQLESPPDFARIDLSARLTQLSGAASLK